MDQHGALTRPPDLSRPGPPPPKTGASAGGVGSHGDERGCDAPSLDSQPAPSTESPAGSSPTTKDPPGRPGDKDAVHGGTEPGAGAPSWERKIEASLEDLDELTIVARAQDGDPQAFEWLVTAYQGGIYRLSYRMLGDRPEAEDAVQDTFILAWRSLPKLSAPQAFTPWLYRTATNRCLDTLRKRRRHPAEPMPGEDLDGQPPPGPDTLAASSARDPAQQVEIQAQIRALADLLQTVPPGPRACWLLREVHEFSYREVAAIVQVPESTVRGRIARAKGLLAKGMTPWR